jgi:hypothetical protein
MQTGTVLQTFYRCIIIVQQAADKHPQQQQQQQQSEVMLAATPDLCCVMLTALCILSRSCQWLTSASPATLRQAPAGCCC